MFLFVCRGAPHCCLCSPAGSLCALSRSYRECNADESNCEMPLEGGRDTLHEQFFSDCLPISQSMKYITDSSRNSVQFLVCHPGQTNVTDNRGCMIKGY